MKQVRIYTGIIALVIAVVAAFFIISNKKQPIKQDQTVTEIDLSRYKNGQDIFITPAELQTKLGNQNLVILDGNHPKLYAKGHIPGAINIGFKGLCRSQGKPGDPGWGTILPKDDLKKKLESLGITNNSLVVCYSETFKGPGAGGRAVWQMRMAGLSNVKLLYGGFSLWQQKGYKITKNLPQIAPSTGLTLKQYDENYRANQQFVFNNIDRLKIIDVRSKKEFTGEDTSRGEARGGHIKSAQWLEWKALLNKDSSPKSPKEIIALMASVGVKPGDDFVVY